MQKLRTLGTLTAALAMAAIVPQVRVQSQVVGPPVNVPGIDKPVRVLKGRFTQDLTLTSDTYWVLRGTVFVHEPARLIVQPGTRVIGETATRGTLVIDRGAQIIADGRADAPIVFTSDQPAGQRARGTGAASSSTGGRR